MVPIIQNPTSEQSLGPSSPVEAMPLPQGIPLKSMIKNLKKKVHHLKKKLKMMKNELQRSKKDCSEMMIEITYLRKLHKMVSMSFINRKWELTEELE